jgi:hypothetical protein
VTLRPIQDLFQVRDVFDASNNFPYVRPDFNKPQFQMYRFLQTPPAVDLAATNYATQVNTWVADVHLLSTYCFLSKEERDLFAAEDQVYLIKEVYEYKEQNVTGSSKVKLKSSSGMVPSWLWFFQRSDIILRNEWSNYSNWAYNGQLPSGLKLTSLTKPITNGGSVGTSNIYITGDFSPLNQREILETFGIVFDGDYRENVMPMGVYNYVEKYTRTNSYARTGIYCYNFCLNTNPLDYQPSGAINLSKFQNIEFEFTTYIPQVDQEGSNFVVNCDPIGNPISVSTKPSWALYKYNYDITIFEERYNVVSFIGGNCGLMYAR